MNPDVADAEWKVWPFGEIEQVFDEKDRVDPMHPIYNIPPDAAINMKTYFVAKEGF